MSKTERLYYDDSFLHSFDATVIEATAEGGSTRVILDRTAFYPTSGGQPFDTGTLVANGPQLRVTEVADRDDGAIVHIVEGGEIAAGACVKGEIDADRRRDHMQQHSGQHVLSAAFVELFGLQTVSFHLGEQICTIDLDTQKPLTAEQVEAAELRANRVVTEDRPVAIHYVTAEEAQQRGVRKLPPREGTIRLIDIRDFDLTACGGTHVRSTGQIGPILLRKTEKVRQGIRVEFVCGERAVHQSRREYLTLARAAEVLSAAPAELPAQVARAAEEAKSAEKRVGRLLAELAEYEARELAAQARERGELRLVEKHYAESDANYAKLIATKLLANGANAALISSTQNTPAVVLAAAKESGINAGLVLKQALTEAGGRGGGSAELAQGGVADAARLAAVVATLRRQLRA